jgi:formate dehydrogenase subunit gamma
MTAVTPRVRVSVEGALKKFAAQPGPLLQILHAVQDELGYVPPESVPLIAEALNLSRAEVHGVISFYHHFRGAPPGNLVVQVCRAEACQAMNGAVLAESLRDKLGVEFGATRADGKVTLESVYCLGNCACAPSITVGGRLLGRVDPEGVDALVESWGVSS